MKSGKTHQHILACVEAARHGKRSIVTGDNAAATVEKIRDLLSAEGLDPSLVSAAREPSDVDAIQVLVDERLALIEDELRPGAGAAREKEPKTP